MHGQQNTKKNSNVMFVSISDEPVTFKNLLQHSTSALPGKETVFLDFKCLHWQHNTVLQATGCVQAIG